MATDKLIRWAGLATIFGSICLVLFPILHPNHDPEGYTSWRWIPAHLMPHLAAIAFLFGLTALYARQGDRNGKLGLAGYVLATVANAQLLMLAWVELFIMPYLGLQFPQLEDAPPPGVPVAGLLMQASLAIGYLVLGVGIIRARVLPRGAGILLVIAGPFFGLGDMVVSMLFPDAGIDLFFFSTTLWALAMGWIGYSLYSGPRARRAARLTGRPTAPAPQARAA